MDSPKFKVRLNCVDYYQSPPTDLDPLLFGDYGSTQRFTAPTVPVIRVFGATETGQKVCAHVHGALPYLYIEYRGTLDSVNEYMQQLRISIDNALTISYRRKLYDDKSVFVAHITLVKGVPFFGYHVGYQLFFKIYLLNPMNMTRFADLLHQGAIMGQIIQPFEAHVQYLAQWMCDYNLYGCANIDCKQVRFREPVPEYHEMESTKHKWHDRTVSADMILDPSLFPRQSHCSIEVDICVQDIMNRDVVESRDIHADFVERFAPPGPDEKLVHSLAGLWRDETRRRRLQKGLTDPSNSPFPPEVLISMSAEPRNTGKGAWIHENDFKQLVSDLVSKENEELPGKLTFESFAKPQFKNDSVQTALQSVEDLFPENLTKSINIVPLSGLDQQEAFNGPHVEINHDEIVNANLVTLEFSYGSDEDVARELALSQKRPYGTLVKLDESDNQAPQPKHRKLDAVDSSYSFQASAAGVTQTIAEGRPRSRHARFEDEVHQYMPLQSTSYPVNGPRRTSSRTPTSSQPLAQSSIKVDNANPPNLKAFSLVKDYQSPNDANTFKPKSILKIPPPDSYSPSVATVQTTSVGKSTKSKKTPSVKSSTRIKRNLRFVRLIDALENQFLPRNIHKTIVFDKTPPRIRRVKASLSSSAALNVIHQDAFYSDEQDVPDRSRDYSGRYFKLESTTTPFLPEFDPTASLRASKGTKPPDVVDQGKKEASSNLRSWESANLPPTWAEVSKWSTDRSRIAKRKNAEAAATKSGNDSTKARSNKGGISQIEGPTQRNKHGFKYSQKKNLTSVRHETQYMSTLSLEVHVNSRENLAPDPEHDEVACIFWCLKSDNEEVLSNGRAQRTSVGILVLSEDPDIRKWISNETGIEMYVEDNELDLLSTLVDIVRRFDPDILTGYEVHNGSWGYLIERARVKYEFNLCDEVSRMKSRSHGRFGKDADRWGFNHTSTIRVTGRHMINIWRAMRSELNLLQYTMENVVFHLLQKRIPHYTYQVLTDWYMRKAPSDLAKCIEYYVSRVQLNLEILEANELIPRTSEQARLIGVDFFSVFSRGSQFKVESFMFRIAKPENFLLVSPSRKQVGQQNALECLPLVMEPQSDFYSSPVLVLDFQSLYPSIMIAYNYCYSTCLGRIVGWRGQNKMGFVDFKRQPGLLGLVEDSINIAPNGMMYVKPEMRKSLLAKMLGEILETRVMVKSGMKIDKDDKTLQQLLNNRQLALKLLANVTYGYTSASFSGRMPCAEVADSIVQTGRETVERAIALIHSVESWGAEIVYGDTDSLFVHLKGRTKEQAFKIGNEIAKRVTEMNPRPIKFKFEKVYHPCVLLAKKRYVGFKYESPSQVEPEFDAKGIETVRRDGTPAEQKIEEKALKLLFRTADLSQVKAYFQRQCVKVMAGKVSIQDFCFAREVKLGTYAEKGPPPPGALIATKRMLGDSRQEPQYGERVPYVVVTGPPRARLIDRCVAPDVLLKDDSAELDAEYYISKNLIPPLERIFNLVGANVRQWYEEMPKMQRIRDMQATVTDEEAEDDRAAAKGGQGFKKTLEAYLSTSHCVVCRTKFNRPKLSKLTNVKGEVAGDQLPLCGDCHASAATSLYTLTMRLATAEVKSRSIETVCKNCAGLSWGEEVKCESKDCPVFYSRLRALSKQNMGRKVLEHVAEHLEEEEACSQAADW